MAKIIQTERSNIDFQGNRDGVVNAPGYRFYHESALSHMCEVTYQLTEAEIEHIKETGQIHLYYMGDTIQPQLMSTEYMDVDDFSF